LLGDAEAPALDQVHLVGWVALQEQHFAGPEAAGGAEGFQPVEGEVAGGGTMIPLRIVALCASCAVITYGYLIGSVPVMLTEDFSQSRERSPEAARSVSRTRRTIS
jgi:hypothetical protein